jgi:hypothetical protein
VRFQVIIAANFQINGFQHTTFSSLYSRKYGSQWSRDLRHELSSPSQTLGSWVRVTLESWMPVYIYSLFVLSCVYIVALRLADPPSKESDRPCKRSRT